MLFDLKTTRNENNSFNSFLHSILYYNVTKFVLLGYYHHSIVILYYSMYITYYAVRRVRWCPKGGS